MPVRRDPRRQVAFAVLAAIVAAASASGAGGCLLALAPALLVLLPLLAGRYVGAERLARLTARRRSGRRGARRPVAAATPRRRPGPALSRGALLLGRALAERGPPVTVA